MHDIVKIIQYFSELSSKVKLSNQLNLMDINILCENQVMRALNMLFDWKLYNANSKSQNTEALDLIDNENHIAIQVTSNIRSSKIKETIAKHKKLLLLTISFICFIFVMFSRHKQKKQSRSII